MITWRRRSRINESPRAWRPSILSLTGAIWCAVAVTAGAQHLPAAAHGRGELRNLVASVEQLTRDVSPSVVQVVATGYGPVEDGSDRPAGPGRGPTAKNRIRSDRGRGRLHHDK